MSTNLEQSHDVYEGNEPYLFISYSHKDHQTMITVKSILKEQNVRYWYDNGLHSGDDWNMVIAKHLKDAAACLLLLSPNSATSEYVKNELNFAMNHRIPIHTLLIKQFVLPLDIEMMTGRIQMVGMEGMYQQKLIKALPPEVFSNTIELTKYEKNTYEHQLFNVEKLLSDRQGTKIHTAKHNRLNYRCVVLEDILPNDEVSEINSNLLLASKIEHPLFPKIVDYKIVGNRVLIYQEYTGARFLDDYLSSTHLSENDILSWLHNVVDGLDLMYKTNLAFRDFARGSMIVTDDTELKIIRNYHPYYGYVKFQEETKRYYFDKELQEIAIFLAQLCIGEVPILPIRIISNNRFSKKFLLKINVIIQKCTKENGVSQYHNFAEVINDITSKSISIKDKSFLRKRAKKLVEYDKARKQRSNNFVSNDYPMSYQNIEEQFGFDGTVVLQESVEEQFGFDDTVLSQKSAVESKPEIKVLMCSTGQVLAFNKKEIVIGRDTQCDMIWTQPYISRMHLKIIRNEDRSYTVGDLNSANGTYVVEVDEQDASWERVPSGKDVLVSQGAKIKVGLSEIQIL